jgi:TRAP transporter 4TM/12TM fusion protein
MSRRDLTGKWAMVSRIIAISMSLFHLYTAFTRSLPALQQRSIHLLFSLVLTFLIYSPGSKKGDKVSKADILFIVLSIITCANIAFYVYYTIYDRAGAATDLDIVLGLIMIVVILEMTRRVIGLALPLITVFFIAYGFLGPWIPLPMVSHRGMDLSRFISYEYLTTEGIFTIPLGVSATFITVFIIFAAFLVESGTGGFFMDLSQAVAGDKRGGPAKVAVISSGAFGMLSGSAVANVVSTGAVTIPLMKKLGYKSHIAGAIEATASTGGQIMPPLMGAAAFVIASFLGIPYLMVCVAAFIPACLYFLSAYFMVHFEALKANIQGLPKETLPKTGEVMGRGFHLLLPLIVLMGSLALGYTEMRAGFYSIIAAMISSTIRRATRMNREKIMRALENGAKNTLAVASACACSGIVVGILTLTGLGLKFSHLLIQLSKGILPLLLVYTMISSLILGMGITTTAAYIIVAILIAPVLVKMGIPEIAAHLYVFYFAIVSTITPPVALAAYAAAGVAKSDPFKVGFTATRIGVAGFVVPFLLIYYPSLTLIVGGPLDILRAIVTGCISVFLFASGLSGYLLRRNHPVESVVLVACGIALIDPHLLTDLLGLAAAGSVVFLQILRKRAG